MIVRTHSSDKLISVTADLCLSGNQARPRPFYAKKTIGVGIGDAAIVIIGSISFIEFPLLGRLFATEIALLAILCFQLVKRACRLEYPPIARVLGLGLFWLLSQIITDIVRSSPPENYLRGWANILFFLANFAALYLLLRTERRLLLYAIGLAIGQLLRFFINPGPEVADDPWKWGLALPVTMFLVMGATLHFDKRNKTTATLLLVVASLLNFYFNYRSQGLICLETLALMHCLGHQYDKHARRRAIYAGIGLFAAGLAALQCYKLAAGNGLLGRAAQEKYDLQSRGDLNILFAGRDESLASVQAIADSPLIGHGSWAPDSGYGALLRQALSIHGYSQRAMRFDRIPSHSHILGAWVDAGFVGALFWSYVFWLAIRSMYAFVMKAEPLAVVTCYSALILLWDIPFSPFGSDRRFITPLYILLVIRAISLGRRSARPRILSDDAPKYAVAAALCFGPKPGI